MIVGGLWLHHVIPMEDCVGSSGIFLIRSKHDLRRGIDTSAWALTEKVHGFFNPTAQVPFAENHISVRLQQQTHNALLIVTDFHKTDFSPPWLAHQWLQGLLG